MDLHYIQIRDAMLFSKRQQMKKRIFDVTVCIVALPALLVLMAVCAVLIWLDDPGPVFIRQQRAGKGGRRFGMYKFRTRVGDGHRATSVGRVLRMANLDELPQVFNVLKGEMSLVGPRPTSYDMSTYSLWHVERLGVLPGITGLWQISGRGEADHDERLRLDIEYIEQQSIWLDIKILFRTFTTVFGQR